jgi:hypothetical protein
MAKPFGLSSQEALLNPVSPEERNPNEEKFGQAQVVQKTNHKESKLKILLINFYK